MSSGWRNWLLLASAGLNLFLLGAFVPNLERLMNPPPHHFAGPGMPGAGPRPGMAPIGFMTDVSRRLNPEDAAAFCAAMGNLPESFMAMERELRAAMADSLKMLREADFDAEKFGATVTRGIVARTQFEERQRDALAVAAASMTVEGREILGTPPHRPEPREFAAAPPAPLPGEPVSGGCVPAK